MLGLAHSISGMTEKITVRGFGLIIIGSEILDGRYEDAHFKATQKILAEKGKTERGGDLKLETLKEGRCIQVLHVGPYEREGETVALLAEFASAQGLAFHGRHHEIYLSDPRRVEPERLKTILRHPVRPA